MFLNETTQVDKKRKFSFRKLEDHTKSVIDNEMTKISIFFIFLLILMLILCMYIYLLKTRNHEPRIKQSANQ